MTVAEKATQHTPGPWKYRGPGIFNSRSVFAELDGKFWCVASITAGRATVSEDSVEWEDVRNEAEANARLIAEAPSMLEALEATRISFLVKGTLNHEDECTLSRIDAAIRKARGEA